ncbi:sporulation related protein [Fluviicoccus keumensis]|uniref:Sporulation related protein n=1 Tax=Fluviicoccus keumensis TaxID=1435465 RepID=A0A4Q7ZAH0_9GAMM|nr:SPOR domain-containing protein [Fluviicoccus keumensis]RZU46883.1 sporulation related protein [Fluviicoccus keumensis]
MDTAIKQRILGGVVLLAGAAIFLPLMLDGTGARLLSRLEPIPAHPLAPTAEKAAPNLDGQAQSAEQAVDQAHEDSTAFYPVGEPQPGIPADTASQVPGPAPVAPPAALAKTPEQLAAEEAARKRANDLLNSTDEISPEEAARQQRSAEKLAREMASHPDAVTAMPAVPAAAADKKVDEERARAILEARNLADQKAADEKAAHLREQKLALEKAAADKPVVDKKAAEDKLKADKLVAEKKLAEDKAKAEKAAEKKLADEKAKADKLKAEKLAAEEKAKADKLAEEKAKAKKLEEQKAKVALEGKAKAEEKAKADDKAESKPVGGSQAWVVQAGSFSDKAKAAELSTKLKGKGFRAQVVKNGDAWKVVVGPELDKGAAKALSGRLSGEAGISGAWVAPWKP